MIEKALVYMALCGVVFVVFFPRMLHSSELHEFLDEDVDFDAVYADLPSGFDLSTATVLSLMKLPYFTLESAGRVIAARDSLSAGRLTDRSDILAGLSPMEHAVLDYLLSQPQKEKIRNISASVRQGIIHDPDREDIADSRYYARLLARSEQGMTISLIGERDRFEPRAFDLVSGSAEYRFDGGRTTVIAGDYRPGFGQGLLFSRYGRIYGNGADIMQHTPADHINTSWEETRFLRGAFLSLKRNRITTMTWFSRRALDATLDDEGRAVTIRETGDHTSGERGNLTETLNGARFEVVPAPGIAVAVSGMVSDYSPELAQKAGETYYHDPEGSTFRYVSLDGSFRHGPATVFFEHARMNRDESATIAGAEITGESFRGCVAARRYSDGFWSYRAGGFSAFGNTSNEQGVYTAFQAELPGGMDLNASMDLAKMLYRRATAPMPESRRRLNMVLSTPSRRDFYAWFGYRSVDDTDTGSRRRNIRLGCDKRLSGRGSQSVRLRSKVAWSEAGGSGGPYVETSLLFRLEHPAALRCTVTGGLFDLPSYDARFYRYEYDVPGRGYTRPVWGRGGALIAVLRWNPLSVRYRWSDSDLMRASHEVALQLDMVL